MKALEAEYAIAEAQRPYFDLLRVTDAWKLTQGSPACVVGIVDLGFDFYHPALRGQLEPGYWGDGVYHMDAFTITAHGTGVASVIVAHNVGTDGMVGLAPGCHAVAAALGTPEHKLLLLQQRFDQEHPNATLADFQQEVTRHAVEVQAFGEEWTRAISRTTAEAIRYLTDRHVRVINLSLFLSRPLLAKVPGAAEQVDAAFAYAAAHDVLILIGAGNDAQRVTDYPGTAETVLVVGAVTARGERWVETDTVSGLTITQGSSFGPRLSVMAPMEKLKTAIPHEAAFYSVEDSPVGSAKGHFQNAYDVDPVGATSMATAVASALAGLVRSLRPDLPIAEVIRVIEAGAIDLGTHGPDELTGHGRIDFGRTLELARTWQTGGRG